MMIVLPKWFGEEEEKLRQAVWDIARRQNIKFSIVMDSKTIDNCIDAIMMRLYNISQEAKPELTTAQLRDFKKFEKAEKKQEEEEHKGKRK